MIEKVNKAWLTQFAEVDLPKLKSGRQNFSVVSIGYDDVAMWCTEGLAQKITPEKLEEIAAFMCDYMNEQYHETIRHCFDLALEGVIGFEKEQEFKAVLESKKV